ncbi:helix-turn-helix domain-containing protein [uncultured Flavonifractor sp.]|uniref:helix-turn-helix domain-containing protein n=1 Tax=uncultured Flavonifractor sp. TaxID=1193534 RepID=UPI0026295F45|nr:helix-turn-helix domain-containing protein [uncultured Flavonifractor sp.]
MEKLAYSVPEAAEVLGVGVQAVYNLAHVAGFPAVRVGNRILIPCESLARWLEAQVEAQP